MNRVRPLRNQTELTPATDRYPYTELRLVGMGRKLVISVSRQFGGVSVMLYIATGRHRDRMLAYATGDLRKKPGIDSNIRIDIPKPGEAHSPCVWIGRAAFELQRSEVESLRQLFVSEVPEWGAP